MVRVGGAVKFGLTNFGVIPMANGKLAVQRLSDTIAHELERRILDGALKPGDRLQPERDLGAELGVSRPSLRELCKNSFDSFRVSRTISGTCHGLPKWK